MQVRLATYADKEAWDDYVLRQPGGVAYQLIAWKEAIEQAYAFEGRYLLAESDLGICGVLPLIDFRIPLIGRSLVSLPYCDVGGILADDTATAAALRGHALEMARQTGARSVEFRNTGEKGKGSTKVVDKVRMILDLPHDSAALLAGLKSKLRSQVNKPLRDGLTAKLGGLDLITDFYRIFSRNMRDLGSPVHSLKWIRTVITEYGERARVGVVYTPEGHSAAAGIILLHDRLVSIPWASSLRKFNSLNPNMLLYWTFLAFAADNGFRQFDFGRSTPGEGTYRFKEQWGAKSTPLDWQEYDYAGRQKPISIRHSRSQPRAKIEAIWRKLPLFVCNCIGPTVRRCVSL